ncbi:spermidine synthase [Ilumatobacter nonamiensis]|uniref:spermidine synthase n=1 Tax=Ilumatobacter nonamiensis TaxID=467093 RepID=UPI000347BE12|nr:spermidine synthase [Ilumatobacter nonamiensis]
MSRLFEELDRQATPIGEISLRRRLEPTLQIDVFEVKIGEDGLMSSLITDGEEAVSTLGLAATANDPLDVVVGGLGLGYTARTALDDPRVRSLRVVDALAPVIDWHRRGLVPLGTALTDDGRCEFVHADFFELAAADFAFDDGAPTAFDAVLLDIDHSPRHLLDPKNAAFYEPAGMARLASCVRPGGVFSLWSNDPPDDRFVEVLADAFDRAAAEVITFDNVLTGTPTDSTIYIATIDPTFS